MLLFVGFRLVFFLRSRNKHRLYPSPFTYMSLSTFRGAPSEGIPPNIGSFLLESKVHCNPPVPFFGLFCQHWRPPGRDCGTVLMLHIFLILGIYTGQSVETIKVYIRCGDYTFRFIRCSDFTAHWVFLACQIFILASVVCDFKKILISVFSFPKSVKEIIKPKFSSCIFSIYIHIYICMYLLL